MIIGEKKKNNREKRGLWAGGRNTLISTKRWIKNKVGDKIEY